MAKIITTGVLNNKTYAPGKCMECGFDDGWQVDGRGNVLCDCQACPDCGMVDAYGFHESGCPTIAEDAEEIEPDDLYEDVPQCALSMGCLCAWHAVGAPVEDECDANEDRARQYAPRAR